MKNNILFIQPAKTYPTDIKGNPLSPPRENVSLPALTLLGSLEEQGFETDFMDLTAEGYDKRTVINSAISRYGLPDEAVVDRIRKTKPLALLVTSMFSSEQPVVDDLTALVKKAFPKLPIILGGIHATIEPGWTLESGNADYVVLGEGEETTANLLRELQKGNQPKTKVISSRGHLKNLDRRLALETVLLHDGEYRYNDAVSRRSKAYSHLTPNNWTRSFSLYYSRGCPMHCDFCATSERDGFRIRHAGSKRMFADFRLLHERYGIQVFYNQADTFGFHPEDIRFLEQVRDYRKEHNDFVINNPNAFFIRMFFPRQMDYRLDESLLDLFAESGFNVMTLAVETFNQRFNRKIDFAKIPPEKIKSLFQAIHERGMKTELYMMYAFPTQTTTELRHDEDTVSTIKYADEITWRNCVIFPGAEYYRQGLTNGWFTEPSYRQALKEGYFFYHLPRSFNFTRIPQKELEQFRERHTVNF